MSKSKKSADMTIKVAKNVADRNGLLRIQFKLPDEGKYIWRSTGLPTTKKNIDIAVGKLANIRTDINSGMYERNRALFWKTHFPSSREAQQPDSSIKLCELFDQFLDERDHELSFSMKNKFKTCKNWMKKEGLLNKSVKYFTTSVLNKLRQDALRTRKVVTVKEYSNALRQIIRLALVNKIISEDPFEHVRKLTSDEFDESIFQVSPFSQAELNSLIEAIHIPQTKVLVEFLAWTGLRHGEAKALSWEDVDLKNRCLYVKYNLDREGKLKPPKSKCSVRRVELLPTAIHLLEKQKEISFCISPYKETIHYKNYRTKEVSRRRVFLSRAKTPYKRPELTTNREHWKKWLNDAGLEYRSAYQLRHTYASQLLRVNADVRWLSTQMGHSDWGYLQTVYGKWIKTETPDYAHQLAKQLGQEYEEF